MTLLQLILLYYLFPGHFQLNWFQEALVMIILVFDGNVQSSCICGAHGTAVCLQLDVPNIHKTGKLYLSPYSETWI